MLVSELVQILPVVLEATAARVVFVCAVVVLASSANTVDAADSGTDDGGEGCEGSSGAPIAFAFCSMSAAAGWGFSFRADGAVWHELTVANAWQERERKGALKSLGSHM